MDYKVGLKDGTVLTIPGVASVEQDGSGMRLLDDAGVVIASFVDGSSTYCYPAEATVENPSDE